MKEWRTKVLRVVSVILMLAMVVSVVGVGRVSVQAKQKKNIVVLYFSATGTTKGAAKRIKKAVGGKIIAIKAAEPYTEEDLDYGNDKSRVTREHKSADSPAKSSVRPKISNLKAIKKAVKKADVVYIGYPIWWGKEPMIIRTFLESYNLKGKKIVPFCTSGGSGISGSMKGVKAAAKGAKVVKGKDLTDSSAKSVKNWAKKQVK